MTALALSQQLGHTTSLRYFSVKEVVVNVKEVVVNVKEVVVNVKDRVSRAKHLMVIAVYTPMTRGGIEWEGGSMKPGW